MHIIYSLILLFAYAFNSFSLISDFKACADVNCIETISLAKVLVAYKAPTSFHLPLKAGDTVRVKSKSAGNDETLWGGEIDGRVGYFPKDLVKEFNVMFTDPHFIIPTEVNEGIYTDSEDPTELNLVIPTPNSDSEDPTEVNLVIPTPNTDSEDPTEVNSGTSSEEVNKIKTADVSDPTEVQTSINTAIVDPTEAQVGKNSDTLDPTEVQKSEHTDTLDPTEVTKFINTKPVDPTDVQKGLDTPSDDTVELRKDNRGGDPSATGDASSEPSLSDAGRTDVTAKTLSPGVKDVVDEAPKIVRRKIVSEVLEDDGDEEEDTQDFMKKLELAALGKKEEEVVEKKEEEVLDDGKKEEVVTDKTADGEECPALPATHLSKDTTEKSSDDGHPHDRLDQGHLVQPSDNKVDKGHADLADLLAGEDFNEVEVLQPPLVIDLGETVADQEVDTPSGQTVESAEPVQKPSESSADVVADEPIEKSADLPADVVVEEPVQAHTESPADVLEILPDGPSKVEENVKVAEEVAAPATGGFFSYLSNLFGSNEADENGTAEAPLPTPVEVPLLTPEPLLADHYSLGDFRTRRPLESQEAPPSTPKSPDAPETIKNGAPESAPGSSIEQLLGTLDDTPPAVEPNAGLTDVTPNPFEARGGEEDEPMSIDTVTPPTPQVEAGSGGDQKPPILVDELLEDEMNKYERESLDWKKVLTVLDVVDLYLGSFYDLLPQSFRDFLAKEPMKLKMPPHYLVIWLMGILLFLVVSIRKTCQWHSSRKRKPVTGDAAFSAKHKMLDSENATLRALTDELNEKVQKLTEEKTQAEKRIATVEKDKKKLEKEKEAIMKEKERTFNELQVTKATADELRVAQETVGRLNTEKDLCLQQVQNLQQSLEEATRLIQTKSSEVHELQTKITELEGHKTQLEKTVEDLQETLTLSQSSALDQANTINYLTAKLEDLDKKNEQLLLEGQSWSQKVEDQEVTVNLLTEERESLQKALVFKDEEIEVLQDCLRQLKAFENHDESQGDEEQSANSQLGKLGELMDAAKLNARLRSIEAERNALKVQMDEEMERAKELERQLDNVNENIRHVTAAAEVAAKKQKDAEDKLKYLSEYFTEKENALATSVGELQLVKKASSEEIANRERLKKASEEAAKMLQEQVKSMKEELLIQEKNFTKRITALDKKAHDNWLDFRHTERNLVAVKEEAADLRRRLLEVTTNRDQILRPIPTRPTQSETTGDLEGHLPLDPPVAPVPTMMGPAAPLPPNRMSPNYRPPYSPPSFERRPLPPPMMPGPYGMYMPPFRPFNPPFPPRMFGPHPMLWNRPRSRSPSPNDRLSLGPGNAPGPYRGPGTRLLGHENHGSRDERSMRPRSRSPSPMDRRPLGPMNPQDGYMNRGPGYRGNERVVGRDEQARGSPLDSRESPRGPALASRGMGSDNFGYGAPPTAPAGRSSHDFGGAQQPRGDFPPPSGAYRQTPTQGPGFQDLPPPPPGSYRQAQGPGGQDLPPPPPGPYRQVPPARGPGGQDFHSPQGTYKQPPTHGQSHGPSATSTPKSGYHY